MLTRTISTIFIERVGNGGFIISDMPPDHTLRATQLAAVTSLDEALTFIRAEVWPAVRPMTRKSWLQPASEIVLPDGFTSWSGRGSQPAFDFDTVDVMFRNGERRVDLVKNLRWEHEAPDHPHHQSDILAYRVCD